jgi:hypothetical protein
MDERSIWTNRLQIRKVVDANSFLIYTISVYFKKQYQENHIPGGKGASSSLLLLYTNAISPLILDVLMTPSSKDALIVSIIEAFNPILCISACFTEAWFESEWPERIEVVSETLGAALWSLFDSAARAALLPGIKLGDGGGGCSVVGILKDSEVGIVLVDGTKMVFRTSLRPLTVPSFLFGVII